MMKEYMWLQWLNNTFLVWKTLRFMGEIPELIIIRRDTIQDLIREQLKVT